MPAGSKTPPMLAPTLQTTWTGFQPAAATCLIFNGDVYHVLSSSDDCDDKRMVMLGMLRSFI